MVGAKYLSSRAETWAWPDEASGRAEGSSRRGSPARHKILIGQVSHKSELLSQTGYILWLCRVCETHSSKTNKVRREDMAERGLRIGPSGD